MKFTCKLITAARLSIALMKCSLLHWYFIQNLRDHIGNGFQLSLVLLISTFAFNLLFVHIAVLQETSIYLSSNYFIRYFAISQWTLFLDMYGVTCNQRISCLAGFFLDPSYIMFTFRMIMKKEKNHVNRSNFNVYWSRCVNLKQPWTMRQSCQLRSSLEAYKSDPCF